MTVDTKINPLPHIKPKYASSVLIQRKSDGYVLGVSRKHDPEDIGTPGGKLDVGENFVDAAVRETFEETGITIVSLEYLFDDYCGDSSKNDVMYYTVAFKVIDWTGEPYSKEAGIVSWVPPQKLITGCFGAYNKKLFAAAEISMPKIMKNIKLVPVEMGTDNTKMTDHSDIDIEKLYLCLFGPPEKYFVGKFTRYVTGLTFVSNGSIIVGECHQIWEIKEE